MNASMNTTQDAEITFAPGMSVIIQSYSYGSVTGVYQGTVVRVGKRYAVVSSTLANGTAQEDKFDGLTYREGGNTINRASSSFGSGARLYPKSSPSGQKIIADWNRSMARKNFTSRATKLAAEAARLDGQERNDVLDKIAALVESFRD